MVPVPLVFCAACQWCGLAADAIEARPGAPACPVCDEPDPIPERPGPGEIAAMLTVGAVALGAVLGIAL